LGKQDKRRIETSEIAIGNGVSESVVLTAPGYLKNGKIGDTIACFAEEFRFKDHGVGLEFKDKERLTEFFQKTRELYADSLLLTDTIFVSGDDVITEWTLQATLKEPFYGDLSRKVRVSVRGEFLIVSRNALQKE